MNHSAEVCPFSREVTFKPLSLSLQRGVRFLRNPLPQIIRLSLRLAYLPLENKGARDIRAYQVSYK